jgi:hypothetical protein
LYRDCLVCGGDCLICGGAAGIAGKSASLLAAQQSNGGFGGIPLE